MIESVAPRIGANPITGAPIAPPDAADDANPINGHERSNLARDDLQFACTFRLRPEQVRDCSEGVVPCACQPGNDSPICAPDPSGDERLQVGAQAYPGIRELQLVKAVGARGAVGSICPAQVDDPQARDFGYRPAIDALVDRVRRVAAQDSCLPRAVPVRDGGRVPCALFEASRSDGACACDAPGRREAGDEHADFVERAARTEEATAGRWDCFCEVVQLEGEALAECQHDATEPVTLPDGAPVDGWCYVDATTAPPTGNPEIVAQCPETERRMLRFLGDAALRPGAGLFVSCDAE